MKPTDEQLQALIDGCQGVTEGPYGTTRKGEIGPYSREDNQSFGMVLPMVDVYGDNAKADQQHFARCDPATIKAMAEELKAARKARADALADGHIVKAVERILDKNSAWIARPNAEVTAQIALAAGIAAHSIFSDALWAMTEQAEKAKEWEYALEGLLSRCLTVLGNMARENEGAIFKRWPINHEPLRADARGLVPIIEAALTPIRARGEGEQT